MATQASLSKSDKAGKSNASAESIKLFDSDERTTPESPSCSHIGIGLLPSAKNQLLDTVRKDFQKLDEIAYMLVHLKAEPNPSSAQKKVIAEYEEYRKRWIAYLIQHRVKY